MCDNNLGGAVIVGTVALVLAAGGVFAGDNPTWNKDLAAKYLDERGQVWLESFPSAERGEGTGKTSCVSCHTLAPYALARPALRQLTGEKEPTKYENELLVATRKRVENWKDLDSPEFQLLYDFNERKKKESWGTEAVLNALILAFADSNQGRQESSSFTKMAFTNLWKTQVSGGDQRGSWDWLDFNLGPWEWSEGRYFGATLAALAVGTAPQYYRDGADQELDKRVNLLRGYVRSHFAKQNLHNRVWLLWAATKLDGLLDPQERKNVVVDIRGKQQPDGGWRLSALGEFKRNDGTAQETVSDGYATGLILHALQRQGFTKDDSHVKRGLDWLRRNQRPSGAWAGSSVNKQREPESTNQAKAHVGKLMWDAATAYAVLALCDSE
jgi:squalene-hopene/tetraprenyl-beta-curcumene cyclase